MAMSEKQITKLLNDLEKKGFRTKFWRDHRPGCCKGSGVGKALDALESLGMLANGSLKDVPDSKIQVAVQAYEKFLIPAFKTAMKKAKSKSGVDGAVGNGMSEAYLIDAKKHLNIARKRLEIIVKETKQDYQQKQEDEKKQKEQENAKKKEKENYVKAQKEKLGFIRDLAAGISKLKGNADTAGSVMRLAKEDIQKAEKSSLMSGLEKKNSIQTIFSEADIEYNALLKSVAKTLKAHIEMRTKGPKMEKTDAPQTIKVQKVFLNEAKTVKAGLVEAQATHKDVKNYAEKAMKETV